MKKNNKKKIIKEKFTQPIGIGWIFVIILFLSVVFMFIANVIYAKWENDKLNKLIDKRNAPDIQEEISNFNINSQ